MKYNELIAVSAVLLGLAPSLAAAQDRDPADIARVIESHTREIAAIYNTYLDAGLALEGTVVVKFTIARTGAVTASGVAEATTACKLFEEAVAAAVTKWDFGPADGDAVTVRYPFTFSLPDSPTVD
ncbi:MAG TPA: AgmX/PglI C-terminal domain-containing protein [bacterium]|nr:AgmX/PglI C-terminal domain-containing protein [bacterium]